MPRKTKQPRERRNRTVAILLTEEEMNDLDQLVELQNRTIRSLGISNVITRSNFIRNLVHKELATLHEPPLPGPDPEPPAPKLRKEEVIQFETS
jgi:hypothetical protein